MRKQILIMSVIALIASTSGYYLAMVMSPAGGGDVPAGEAAVPAPLAAELVGQRRPDFQLQDRHGNPVAASDFDGQAWLVNFWATWCAPCVEEMPMLSRLQQDYADTGLRVVGIALDDPVRASEFAADLNIVYPVLVGRADVVMTGRKFGNATGMLPFSVLVDNRGIIRWTRLGALSLEELEEQIRLLQ